jgi:uronate dehydrogenase
VWGVSNNARRWWDNAGSERLGYRPVQDAEDYAAAIEAARTSVDPVAARYQGGSFASHGLQPRTARETGPTHG